MSFLTSNYLSFLTGHSCASFFTVRSARSSPNVEEGGGSPERSCTDLPSYEIASGLPSYDDAILQLQRVKEPVAERSVTRIPPQEPEWVPRTPPTPVHQPLSEIFRQLASTTSTSTTTPIKPT